jgi:DsbC/DsbD-like thiol-disulfide interchange protein
MNRVVILLAALPTIAGIAPSVAAEGAWGEGAKASARLIASGVDADGTLSAGIEIVLPPGWHTYWRTPGDAGIAPTFDFSASANVADVEVRYPLPTRHDDGFSVTNVYYERVVFPVAARVVDPSQPATLSLAADLGVCSEICVPDSVAAELTVAPGEDDRAVAAVLDAARAGLPGEPEPGVFAVADVERDGGTDKRPLFRIVAVVPDTADAEIFVEGPDAWAGYVPKPESAAAGSVAWSVKFSRLGDSAPPEGAPLRITVISDGRAIEETVRAR